MTRGRFAPLARVCVFCGSKTGSRPEYRTAAAELGRLIGDSGLGLVYGGGNVGLMGVIADAALAAGAEVIGVIPRVLQARELAHAGCTEMHVVETMHERKALMAGKSDAFLALPGGIGTMEELFEAVTWVQLGIHNKPCGLLDVGGFYRPLLDLLHRFQQEGFLHTPPSSLLAVATGGEELLTELARRAPGREFFRPGVV